MDLEREWPLWEDVLGQTFATGDTVAYASISGRSPELVIATVERINRVNPKGETITTTVWDTPDRHWAYDAERITIEYCTVKAQPLLGARGFYRAGKAVTLTIPQNIIRVDPPHRFASGTWLS